MVLKVYISGMSGNKEVKKRQQRVLMILDSKNIQYEVIDITEPGREADKEFMQNKSTSNGATVSDPEPRHALPPQLFNEEDYCGDYDAFDLANEIDTLEQFLKVAAADITAVSNTQIELKQENGEGNDNGGENKENESTEHNKEDENAEKPECNRLQRSTLRQAAGKVILVMKISIKLLKNNEQIDASPDKDDKKDDEQRSPINNNSTEPLSGATMPAALTEVNGESTVMVTKDLVETAAAEVFVGEAQKAIKLESPSSRCTTNNHLMGTNQNLIDSNEKTNDQEEAKAEAEAEENLKSSKINNDESSSIQDTMNEENLPMRTKSQEYQSSHKEDGETENDGKFLPIDCEKSQSILKYSDPIEVTNSDLTIDKGTEDDGDKVIHNQENLIVPPLDKKLENEMLEEGAEMTNEASNQKQEIDANIQDEE
ncbi:SH3 domain binding glutamate rich protein Sh3beta isoform 1-T2 [Glossina fuscipes fuscipes]